MYRRYCAIQRLAVQYTVCTDRVPFNSLPTPHILTMGARRRGQGGHLPPPLEMLKSVFLLQMLSKH